ncbi:hypothetical protein NDU88_004659 [Pleurodeles waltl]|uniref:Uncharacterized protein n=1 Tax=Pleurodeles waltl TaxID=8319 RepID=A0AAV7LKP1_PLEWA|nr:hypothetical protein NDU88_004659 [Pleurodeles waltl]
MVAREAWMEDIEYGSPEQMDWQVLEKSGESTNRNKEVKGSGIRMDDREEEDEVHVEKERKVYRRSSVRVKEPSRLLKDFVCG